MTGDGNRYLLSTKLRRSAFGPKRSYNIYIRMTGLGGAAIATGPHDGLSDETSVAWLRWRYRSWATWAENSKMAPQASVGPTAIVPLSRRWNGTP